MAESLFHLFLHTCKSQQLFVCGVPVLASHTWSWKLFSLAATAPQLTVLTIITSPDLVSFAPLGLNCACVNLYMWSHKVITNDI